MGGGGAEVGVQASVSYKANSDQRVISGNQVHRPSQTGSSETGGSNDVRERSYRGGDWREGLGLLLQALLSQKEERQVETCDQPQEVKQVLRHSKVQDGNNPVCVGRSESGELYLFPGSPGRILPRTHPQELPQVPKILLRGKNLSIQGPSIRLEYQPLGLHQDSIRGERDSPSHEHSSEPIPGRLASPGSHIPARFGAGTDHAGSVSGVGTTGKSGEIRANTQAGFHIYRRQIQPSGSESLPLREQSSKTCQTSPVVSRHKSPDSQKVAVTPGDIGVPGQVHKICKVPHKTTTVAPEVVLESSDRIQGQDGRDSSIHKGDSQVVAKTSKSGTRSTSSGSSVQGENIHRRLNDRLGRSSRGPTLPGSVDDSGKRSAHKCVGNESHLLYIGPELPSSPIANPGCNRQQDSHGLCEQRGRNQVMVPDDGDIITVQTPDGKPMDSQGSLYPRVIECHSRPVVKERTNSAIRVVSSPTSSKRPIPKVGDPVGRPICHQVQQEMRNVCFTSARPSSLGRGRSFNEPRRTECLRIPSSTDNPEVPSEISASQKVQGDSDSSILAETGMVSGAVSIGRRKPSRTASQTQPTETTSVSQVPYQAGEPKVARMASREVDLQNRGFDSEVISRVVKPHAVTTEAIYDGKWKIWLCWCTRNDVDCYNPSISKIADFLDFLFKVQKVEYSTVAGYRSMLSGALVHTGLNIGHDRDISDLMLSFRHSRPPRSRVYPDWDLALVLWSLTEFPFEPMFDEKVSMQLVTWKTAFLVLLASGGRRGEIHDIPFRNVSYDKDFSHVTLRPSEHFVAKTQVRTGVRLKSFRIPSLQSVLSEDLPLDRKLCPCRAVKHYIKRSEPLRKKDPLKQLFFVSHDPRKKGDICKNTLSGWISQLIRFVYSQPGSKALKLTGTRAHEVRAYATSLVSRGTYALEDILQAGNWKSHSTFTEHYLRDLSSQEGDLLRLGPIVAGQRVVVHTSNTD